jgi:xanthine dehydrogenase accessory factor
MNHSILYSQLLELLEKGIPCVLATVAQTKGSAPQKPGSSAIICMEGLYAGTIGGGAVENLVLQKANECFLSGDSGYERYDLYHDIHVDDGPICGGHMEVLVDAAPTVNLHAFKELADSVKNGRRGWLVTTLTPDTGEKVQISRRWISGKAGFQPPGGVIGQPATSETGQFTERFLNFPGAKEDPPRSRCLAELVSPPPHLFIAGAGHIGKALTHLGHWLGFEVTVWDDRTDLADESLLPEASRILTGSFKEALDHIRIDSDTYMVLVTRGHASDALVLKEVIRSEAAYIGMIGSRRKTSQMKAFFLENRWATDEEWSRIHAPVGIDIGSETVSEIAVSIAAELIKVRNRKMKQHG